MSEMIDPILSLAMAIHALLLGSGVSRAVQQGGETA